MSTTLKGIWGWVKEKILTIIFSSIFLWGANKGYNMVAGGVADIKAVRQEFEAMRAYQDSDKVEHKQLFDKWTAQQHFNDAISDSVNRLSGTMDAHEAKLIEFGNRLLKAND